MISEKAVNHAQRVSTQLNGYVLDLCKVLKRKKSHKKIDLEIQYLVKIIAVGSKAVRLLLQDDEETIKKFERK